MPRSLDFKLFAILNYGVIMSVMRGKGQLHFLYIDFEIKMEIEN